MAAETTVQITLKGVREAQVPRLKTVIKSYLQQLAREIYVDDGLQNPKPKPKEGRKRGK